MEAPFEGAEVREDCVAIAPGANAKLLIIVMNRGCAGVDDWVA